MSVLCTFIVRSDCSYGLVRNTVESLSGRAPSWKTSHVIKNMWFHKVTAGYCGAPIEGISFVTFVNMGAMEVAYVVLFHSHNSTGYNAAARPL